MANKYKEHSKIDDARRDLFKRIHGKDQRQKMSCIRKKKYDTKDKALGKDHAKRKSLKAYRCGYCNYWHLTKQEQHIDGNYHGS